MLEGWDLLNSNWNHCFRSVFIATFVLLLLLFCSFLQTARRSDTVLTVPSPPLLWSWFISFIHLFCVHRKGRRLLRDLLPLCPEAALTEDGFNTSRERKYSNLFKNKESCIVYLFLSCFLPFGCFLVFWVCFYFCFLPPLDVKTFNQHQIKGWFFFC